MSTVGRPLFEKQPVFQLCFCHLIEGPWITKMTNSWPPNKCSIIILSYQNPNKPQVARCSDAERFSHTAVISDTKAVPPQPKLQPQATVLKEPRLTSAEKGSPPFHSSPMNLAKENSGWFFTSSRVTELVLLSAGGKLQVSHCVRGSKSQSGGFPCVTGACSGCRVFI